MSTISPSLSFPLRQSGIYRNLPNFDPAVKGLSALVCGASGISGFHAIRALLDTPDRWARVYALSRKPIPTSQLDLLESHQRVRIHHVAADLYSPPEKIALALKESNVQADYAFFFAYCSPNNGKSGMSTSNADDLVEANVPLLRNFLAALELGEHMPRRILLQTGAKNFGSHIGRARTPLVESDPQPRNLQSNFYYNQEDDLVEFCRKHPEVGWNIVRPVAVVGAATASALNMFLPFAVHAAIQARKGEPLLFGSDYDTWQYVTSHSSARLTGFLAEWAVLENQCRNEAFNAADGGTISWDRLFGELTRWFNISAGVQEPEADDSKLRTTLALIGGKDCPMGYGPPVEIRTSFNLLEWFQRPENSEAWKSIMEESSGKIWFDPFAPGRQEFLFGDFMYFRGGTMSTTKVKHFGFNGFVDPLESIFEMFAELSQLGVLPPLAVSAARPLK